MDPIISSPMNGIRPEISLSTFMARQQSLEFIPTSISSCSVTRLCNDYPTSFDEMMSSPSPSRITPPHASPIPTTLPMNVHQENINGTIYFYPIANHATAQSPNTVVNSVVDPAVVHHDTPQLVAPISSPAQPISNRNEISNLMFDSALPTAVDNYHSLYPLETVQSLDTLELTMPSSTYQATHSATGIKYCLRRLHGIHLQLAQCVTVVAKWAKLKHSNVVQLREVFTTEAFGDKSLVLVYQYHPNSETLIRKYFTPTPETNGRANDPFQDGPRPFSYKRTSNGPLLEEATIWEIIMQLTAGLRAIHQAGLACKVVDPTKIIVTGKRIRFSFCGTSDISQFEPNATNPLADVSIHQQEDLVALGRLVLALACRRLKSAQCDNFRADIELVTYHYSNDLRNFIVYLCQPNTKLSMTDLMPMIGPRFYTQLDALQNQCDMQEDELAKEVDNGRLYRILLKLNCINERPEHVSEIHFHNLDCTWSETGDRYLLKLFRDYLFHSVTEDGRPWFDHAHIVQCLNKLDTGSLERVQLKSRDEQSVLNVTYALLKNCLEDAFSELVADATT